MEDNQAEIERKERPGLHRKQAGARFLSQLLVLGALALLLCTCRVCCPEVGQRLRRLAAGVENSPAAQAFSSLTQSLGEGEDALKAFSESYEVLKGAKD